MKRSGVPIITLSPVFGPAAFSVVTQAKTANAVRLRTFTGVEANTANGVVTLAGRVKGRKGKAAIERLVHDVDGVKSIKNNPQAVS